MTTLTDYVLAAVAAALATRLVHENRGLRQRSMGLWAAGFFATAGAALLGGTYHGFATPLAPGTYRVLWRLTVLCIGASSLFTLAGSVVGNASPERRRGLLVLTVAKFALFVYASSLRGDFVVPVVDYVSAMLLVLFLEFRAPRASSGDRRWWFLGGTVVSFGAAGLQQARIGLHEHFNHNDLYHVIQTGALFLLYAGARRLRDRAREELVTGDPT